MQKGGLDLSSPGGKVAGPDRQSDRQPGGGGEGLCERQMIIICNTPLDEIKHLSSVVRIRRAKRRAVADQKLNERLETRGSLV